MGEAEADLGRDRHLAAHGIVYGRYGGMYAVGVAQQRGAAVMAVDELGRAAEIEVDFASAEPQRLLGVGGQRRRVAAQQLERYRNARGRRHASIELGAVAEKDPWWQACIDDAYELRHRPVEAGPSSKQITGMSIDHALHGGESDPTL